MTINNLNTMNPEPQDNSYEFVCRFNTKNIFESNYYDYNLF
jgi:hypothetical protein